MTASPVLSAAAVAALALITLSSAFLFVYGVNLLYLSWLAARLPAARRLPPLPWAPTVLVQLPVYNERFVAERAVDAAARLRWPRDRLEIQVLDDSDDDTPEIVGRAVALWRRAGVMVAHVRRQGRAGYKAGALAHGLQLSSAETVAVFDADFVPAPDFLEQTMPALSRAEVGFVQARWGCLNEDYSLFTHLQALMTDFHFLVEQSVRPRHGYLTNFTGSAGVWRRAAIEDAGGWSARTLTEDLDLSYRAQLRGWKAAYVEGTVVPQELPVSVSAYRNQQARWATGSFQCAFRLLGAVLRAPLSRAARFQAAMHLLGYAAPVAMLLQIACYPVLLAAQAHGEPLPGIGLPLFASLLSLAPCVGLAVAQARRGRSWSARLPGLVGWSFLGAGTSLTVAGALLRALRPGGEFRRTPKYRIERAGQEWRSTSYFNPTLAAPLAELVFGGAAVALGLTAPTYHLWTLALYAWLFGIGFLALSLGSLVQATRRLRYEAVALGLRSVLRAALPGLSAPALVAGAGALLLLFTRLPEPFEDSYGHWLIAANLASTGRLQDPLFQMQDTWLPAWHVVGALMLRVVGLWQLGALRALNVGFGVATLVLTYQLAGSRRRGLAAVLLLALNPIFLLTSTSAVAEPLLLASLLAAILAAERGRPALAALFACLACLTGTKAWLWLGAVAVIVVVSAAWWRRGSTARRLAWVAPALALAVTLQGIFGFASHSVARAAVEVGSASARGSLPAEPLVRGGQFLAYFAIASVPVLVLAPLGVMAAVRERDPLLRLLYAPSLLYLAAVVGLVSVGVYSGSHRYYEPALPGLALLAAGSLDRIRPAVSGAVGLAAAAVTAAFVPVFSGLAADNRGLVAAGQTVAMVPGGLLTDSPAAAYWSHKPVTAIHGSRQLPEDPGAALGWLRAEGVGGLVLEDVDYYRANRSLAGLVRGEAAPPFISLGEQTAHTVPGGKSVHAYRIGPPTPAAVVEGVKVGLDPPGPPQPGKTAPLAKGATLLAGDRNLAGEGVGFGVPIVRYPDGWHYPGSAALVDLSTPAQRAWRKTFDLNLVGGDAAHDYRFRQAPSVGRVQVTYRVSAGRLRVEARPLGLSPGVLQTGLLNEQSAAFDDLADAQGIRLGADYGRWESVSGPWARLRSSVVGVEWAQAVAGGSQLYAGRESQPPDFDWSGLDYLFGPDFHGVDYDVVVRKAR